MKTCFILERWHSSQDVLFRPVIAVRRARVNLQYVQVSEFHYAGVVGDFARETRLVFVEDGVDVLACELETKWCIGEVEGFVADFPYPPLPGVGEDGQVYWSRLVASGYTPEKGYSVHLTNLAVTELSDTNISPSHYITEFENFPRLPLLVLKKRVPLDEQEAFAKVEGGRITYPSDKLTGEEFRIVELDNDYLRLVGRGGDEYIAWDFVLGTLDTGEWVLVGDDGLYLAKREEDKVVVKRPYRGSVFDVRGPPYMPYYPVVPVKWVRERLERVREIAKRLSWDGGPYIYEPPVDPQILLKWPLRNVRWEFRVRGWPVRKIFPPMGVERVEVRRCHDLCDLDDYLYAQYKTRVCGEREEPGGS